MKPDTRETPGANPGASLKPAAVSILPPSPRSSRPKWIPGAAVALVLAGAALTFLVLNGAAPVVAAAFPLPAVELAPATPDVALETLQGAWLTSDCEPSKGPASSSVVEIVGGQITETRRVFSEAGCLGELYSVVIRKSVSSLKSLETGRVQAAFSLGEVDLVVRDAARLNEQKFLGHSDWKSGETRSAPSELSAGLFGKLLRSGESTYDLLQLDNQHLRLAFAPGELSEPQPSQLSSNIWTRLN